MPIKSYTDDDLWGDSPSAPQSQPTSTARSIDDIWENPKKYAPSPPPPLSARTIDDIWGDAESVSDLGQLNKTTEDIAGPTGPVDAFSRSVSRAAESAFQGILGARVGMGKLPSMAALKAMSVYDPDKYDEITSSPDKMRQYQNSWEGIPVVGSINVDTTNEDMYRKWIAESKGKVETELSPSKKTLESESKGTWYRDLNWWAERSPEAVTQLAAAAATNILAPGAGLVEAGTVAGGSVFLNAEERLAQRGDKSPGATLTAVGEGVIMGVLEGLLEKVPLDLITKNKFVKGRVFDTVAQKIAAAGPRFAGVAAAEATEEIASEVADMALQRVFEQDPTAFDGAGQRVAMAGALGAAAGGPMGIPATIGQVQRGRQLGELKAARPEIQEERTKAHMQEAEAMTNQLLQTEEGKKSLLELSQKPEPSRKDFENAGYDTGRLRLNAEQRKQYAAELQQWVRPVEQEQPVQDQEPAKVEGPVPPTTPAADAQAEALPSPDTMQQVEEAVKETVKITGGAGVGNEKAMFGPKGLFAKGFAAAKKKLGHTTGNALTPEARQLIAGTGDKKMQREMKSSVGSSFEKFVSPAGSKRIIERAVDDVAEFMAKEGGDKFAEYYQQQSDEEAQVLRQRFPEMDPQSPAGPRMFQFYRMLNAMASAQTELSKNTEETMSAYAGVRQTGRVPVAFDENGDPIYSLPKGDDSRFEGPIYSDINSITDTVKKLSETIDKDAMDVLLKRAPVPEGLVQLGGTYKDKPVKTYKDYLYGYFAEKYVTSEAKKGALTTSNGLVAKLVREIATTPESEFKKRVRTAFEIGGGSSQYNKAFNYQVLNDLMARPEFQTVDASGRNTPDMPRIVEWLNERVTPEELNAEKEKLGYGKIQPSTMKDIIDTVWTAEGQEATVPRTFLFGPKVGAYMLNRMADADPRNTKYNTMDVWESRFWRYINNGIPDTASGIAEGIPRRIYMRQAREFAKVWEEKMGTPMSVSAGQAARWYLMKESAKKAGYGKAGENETIPHWTMKAIEKYMENELGQEAAGDMGQTLAGVFSGQDLQELNEYEQGIREERAAIQTEKPGKATKAELTGPWTKPAKKVQKPSGQKELFPEEGPKPIPPEEAVKTTVQDIGVTPATPELAEGITSVSFQENAPQKPARKISATTIARLPDAPSGQPDPNPIAHAIKNEYLKSVGIKPRRQSSYVKVNAEFAKRLADAYESLVSDPSDPEVKKAYEALAKETIAQWKAVKKSGIKIEFIKEGMEDPYKSGPREVHDDILNNNHLWVFPTTSGYGHGENLDSSNNPMLQKIGEVVDGHEMLVNDAFRIVHDYFGHSLEGASFGARGEENAWQAHVRMFSPLAARAMTTETRGQNSWVNYGPYGKKNREKQSETTFAEQKIGLLPEWASKENITPDVLEKANDDTLRQEAQRNTKDTAPDRDEGKATTKAREAKPTAAAGGKPAPAAAEGVPDEGVKAEAPGTEVAPSRASTESVVDYEDPATLDERESYFQQGRIDWKPNTGPQGARTGKPKPKREVVRDVLERVGIVSESYKVHERGPGILGYYRWALTRSHIFKNTTGSELWLKASELANIGTAVHEAAHYLDQKFNLSGKVHQLTGAGVQPSPVGPGFLEGFSPAIQNSFRMLDYHVAQKGVLRPDPVSGLAEGWAEAVRLYVESADPSSVLGPDVKSTIDSLVMNNPEIAKILNATRSDVQAYLNSSDAEKVSMAMQDPSRALANPSESYFARQDRTGKSRGWYRLMAKKFQNRIRDLEEYEKQLKKTFLAHWSQGSSAMTGEQAWDQVLRDSGGLASQLLLNSQNMISRNTDHAILHYIQDPLDGTNMGPSGRSAFESFESQKELDDFGRYMYAKVAMNRWVQAALEGKDYIVGETDQAVLQRVINEVESGPNAAKFAKASRDVTDYFNNLLELEVKYGLKTRGEVDAMKAKHDIYMPFFRQLEQRMSGTGGKVIGVKSGVRKLGGGSVMPVLDTYDAMIDRTNDLYSTVVRKAVETSFIKTAELSGVSGDFIRKLTAEEAENVKDVTKITTGGTTYYYKIDPDLKYALSQVNPQLSPMIADLLGIVGVPTGIAKKFMVTFNIPYFTTKNYVRDLKTSSIRGLQDITGIDTTGGAGLSPAAAKRVGIDLPRALIGLGVKMTDIEMLFERQGGTKATVVKTTRSGRRRLGIATRVAEYVNPTIGEAIANLTADQTKRRVFLGAKDRSAFQAARDFVTKAAEWTESVNDSVELAARREAFMRTLRALGKTAGAGFSVSDDGSVTGDVPQWALSRSMYNAMEVTTNFNRRGEWQPLIEPVFLFYNAAIQGTAGQIMTAKNAINSPIHRKRFAMAVALGAAAKILAMAVMYDDEDEDGVTSLEKWAEIPDYIRENNDVWVIRGHAITIPREREWGFFHRAVDSVVAQYMRGETPSAGAAAGGIKKEIGQRLPVTGGSLPTIAQLYFGKDIFRGEDIESYWDQKKLPQYRYDERTSSLAKFVGSAADYTGLSPKEADFMIRNTFGSLGPKGTDFLTGLVTGEQGKLSSVPFLGGFMTDMIPRQSQSDYMALRNRSSMEFDEWAKNRGAVPEEAVARILDNESTIGVADHIMKSIRENDKMDNDTKAKYITGLARWALDREPVAEYPNPLLEYYHQDIPVEVRKEILKALKEARSATVRATEDIPKGTEKYREAVKSKRRLGQKLVRPTPKEME